MCVCLCVCVCVRVCVCVCVCVCVLQAKVVVFCTRENARRFEKVIQVRNEYSKPSKPSTPSTPFRHVFSHCSQSARRIRSNKFSVTSWNLRSLVELKCMEIPENAWHTSAVGTAGSCLFECGCGRSFRRKGDLKTFSFLWCLPIITSFYHFFF